MKLLIAFILVAAAAAAVYDVYPTKYDSLDVDGILKNRRLVDIYVQCLVRNVKCNEEGSLLRDIIPDALITGCRKCNDRQKAQTEKVIRFLIKERNSDWEELLRVYDPTGEFRAEYAQYLDGI